tara:strand:+ start:1068 stop:1334 length:267 start_codon:yes stop_codon:yes gene_type:complete
MLKIIKIKKYKLDKLNMSKLNERHIHDINENKIKDIIFIEPIKGNFEYLKTNHNNGIDMTDNICKTIYQDIADKIDPLELKKPTYELP